MGASIGAVRDLRASAVFYRNGPTAVRVATAYAGLVVLVAAAVVAELALRGPHDVHTVALFVATLPGSAVVLLGLVLVPGLPDTSGLLASGYVLTQVAALTGAGLGQAWVLWRIGRGPRVNLPGPRGPRG